MGSKLSWIHCSTHSSPETMYVKFRSRATRHTKARRESRVLLGCWKSKRLPTVETFVPKFFRMHNIDRAEAGSQRFRGVAPFTTAPLSFLSLILGSLLSVFLASKRNRFVRLDSTDRRRTLWSCGPTLLTGFINFVARSHRRFRG